LISLYFNDHTVCWCRVQLGFDEETLARHERIGALHAKKSAERSHDMIQDLTDKIWYQQDAIYALPQHLFEKAMEIDETPPPSDRPFPIWETPPIPGFQYSDVVRNARSGAKEEKTKPSNET
jgi:hypothetical protein